MAKAGLKDILLRKGEKIAIGIGVGLLGLLGLMGLMNVVGAESPAQTVKEFQGAASRIQQGVTAEGQPADPLPAWVQKQLKPPPIGPEVFAAADTIFEPIHQPDFLRQNPTVLGPVDFEYHLIDAPMPSLDIEEGQGGVRIGVLANRPVGEKSSAKVKSEVQNILNHRDPKNRPKTPQRPRRPGGGGGFGGLPGGGMMPGGPGGGGMMPGGPGRGGSPGGGMMPGGPGGGMMPGGPGGGGMPGGGESGGPEGGGMYGSMYGPGGMYTGGQRDDRSVEYLTPEEVSKQGKPLAQTVYPLKALLVQLAFPYKMQVEENRKAMRMPEHKGATMFGGAPGFGGGEFGMPQPGGPGGGSPMTPGRPGTGVPGAPGAAGSPGAGMPGSPGAGMPGAPGGYASGAAYINNPEPVFAGFEVERRVLPPGPNQTWSEWAFYDHENEYFSKIRARKWEDDPDTGYLLYFLRPVAERMWAPLPKLADDLAKWPDLEMKVIKDNIKKLEEAGKPKITPTEWQKRFEKTSGAENPYAPVGAGTYGAGYGAGAGGMPGSPDGGEGGFGMKRGGGIPGGPGAGGSPGGMPGSPGGMAPGGMPGGMAGSQTPLPEVEYTLMRFLDVDAATHPGYSFQYRVRVKMKNPNHNQKDKVSRPADAKVETLYGMWAQLPDVITIPPEKYVYAGDVDRYIHDAEDLYKTSGREPKIREIMEYRQVQEGKRAIVQFQTWMSQVRIDGAGSKTEPIGTWVSAEMPVAPGNFIGHRQLIELPLWSASQQAYVLRELSGGVKVAGLGNQKNQPKGWPVNFRTPSVLVDFVGGKTKANLADRSVTDDSATEVLILQPDGKLLVRNSLMDQADPAKKERQETWDKWIERVKQRKEAPQMSPMEGGSGFERGGGKGGGR